MATNFFIPGILPLDSHSSCSSCLLGWRKEKITPLCVCVCVFNTRRFQWFCGGVFFSPYYSRTGRAIKKWRKILVNQVIQVKSEMTICFIVVIVVLRNNLCIDVEFGKCDLSSSLRDVFPISCLFRFFLLLMLVEENNEKELLLSLFQCIPSSRRIYKRYTRPLHTMRISWEMGGVTLVSNGQLNKKKK